MSLLEVNGQKKISDILSRSIANNRIFHAYIFSGAKGVGKQKMAMEFAKALNCTEKGNDACNQCLSCKRIQHYNHPDVIWIEPDGSSIKIDQVRQLQKEFVYKKTKSTKYKVYIIQQAELLTNQAANSLLKFLEEPESNTVAILITENPNRLLPTIRSRCQNVYFSQLDPFAIVDILVEEGYKEGDILLAANVTQDIDKIREMLNLDAFAQMRNIVIQLNEDILQKNYQALLAIDEKILKNEYIKEHFPIFLDLLLIWNQDILNMKLNKQSAIINKGQEEVIKTHSGYLTIDKIIKTSDIILQTKKRLLAPVNTKLVLEHLVLSLWEG